MKTLFSRFFRLNIYLKIIVILCLLGFIRNTILLVLHAPHVVMGYRLFGAFALIYLMQVILILMYDRRAALFSGIQCIFALFVYRDFTFLAFLKPVFKTAVEMQPAGTDSFRDFLQYVMVSMLFSVEALKTFLIWDFLELEKHEKQNK